MRIHLIAVGRRMPGWIAEGYEEYARRLPKECSLHLTGIPAAERGRSRDPRRSMAKEGERMLAAAPKQSRVVALDESGSNWSTRELSQQLDRWMQEGSDVCLLVGGADGLSEECRARATQTWSLSRMTLPHMLVRVVVAEQVYRAWSVLVGHPYHRD